MGKSCESSTSDNIKLRLLEDRLRADLAPKDTTTLPDCDGVVDEESQFYIYENDELRHITWNDLKDNLKLNIGDASAITIENGNWYLNGTDTGVSAHGSQGPQGEQGKQGLQGEPGKDGTNGKDGVNGQDGAPGKNGKDGLPGAKGDKGEPGIAPHISADGYWWVGEDNTHIQAQGPKGDKGERGEPGCASVATIGDNGNWWIDGKDTGVSAKGPKGDRGETGLQGDRGLQGEIGATGPQGLPGEKGDKGADGKDGQPGEAGRGIVSITRSNIDQTGLVDTYAINYTYGDPSTFTVTNGKNGIDGKNGITPHIGDNNNWFIGEVDTKIPAIGQKGEVGPQGETGPQGQQGIQGIQGEPGLNGLPGKDGVTPLIGENGNWIINGVDTNVHAQGPQGETGIRGPQGDPGIPGEPGKDGIDGTPGKNGTDGIDGNKILVGNGEPLEKSGVNGDYYLDMDNSKIYTKTLDSWVTTGILKGVASKIIAKGGWDNAIPLTTFVEPIENFKTLVISFYHKDANPSRAFTITVPTSILTENKAVHNAVCFYKGTDTEEMQLCDASVSIDRSETPSLKLELSSVYLQNNNVVILPHSAKTATWITEVIGEN